jgi:hypothetical protein
MLGVLDGITQTLLFIGIFASVYTHDYLTAAFLIVCSIINYLI